MVRTPQALQGLSVLIVDDHRDTVDMFEQYLALFGAQVTGACSAKEALAMLATQTVDVALVDLRMPREDGWSFVSQLRASRTASAHAPVFAISGERCDQLDPAGGFAGYFFKPVDLDALVAALAALPRRSE